MISTEQAVEIFEKYEIKVTKNDNGMFIISHYCQPKDATFKDLGINEDELLQNVVACEGRFDTKNSSLTSFPLTACRELRLDKDVKIVEMPNLKAVGTLTINEYLKKAPKLKTVGSGYFENSNIKSLPKLKEAGILVIQNSKIENLSSLEKVAKLCIVDTPIQDLKNLEYGQDIFICSTDENNKTPITSLAELNEVERLFVANTALKSLPKLKIAKKIALFNCEIKSLKTIKDAEIEISKQISDEELNEKFDNFTDWYNSDVLNNSMKLIGGLAASI